jgi:hypothetical protein
MGGSCHLKANKGDGQRPSQRGVSFEQRDIGLDDPVAESGLKPAQLGRCAIRASNRRGLVRAQLGDRNREL